MALFDIAHDRLQPLEGGYVNSKYDRGGPTNFGLSSKFLNSCNLRGDSIVKTLDDNGDGMISAEEIKNIKPEESAQVYKIYFWLTHRYGELKDQELANNIFDFGVHAGNYKANILLQKSLNEIMIEKIMEDGLIGNNTLAAANNNANVIERFKEKRRQFYKAVVAKNPTQERYLKGWLARVDKK